MFKPIEQVKAEQEYEKMIERKIGLSSEDLEKYLEEVFSEKERDYGDTSTLKIYHDKNPLSFTIGNLTTGILGMKFYMQIYKSYNKNIMFEKIFYNGIEVDENFVNKLLAIENNM